MHFIDQINFVPPLGRCGSNVFTELPHVFDTVVAGAVNLDHIETVAGSNLAAIITYSTWSDSRAFYTIKRLRQNPRSRRLADTPWANKQISMGKAILRNGVFQR